MGGVNCEAEVVTGSMVGGVGRREEALGGVDCEDGAVTGNMAGGIEVREEGNWTAERQRELIRSIWSQSR